MIEYRDHADGIDEAALAGFFAGWPSPPSPATHLRILDGSDLVAIAVEDEAVVGFATAISDGVLCAYIPLVEVRTSHHGRGIGSTLVSDLIRRLDGLYMIDTSCDEDLVGFYERAGMQRGVAMVRRDFAAQGGLSPG